MVLRLSITLCLQIGTYQTKQEYRSYVISYLRQLGVHTIAPCSIDCKTPLYCRLVMSLISFKFGKAVQRQKQRWSALKQVVKSTRRRAIYRQGTLSLYVVCAIYKIIVLYISFIHRPFLRIKILAYYTIYGSYEVFHFLAVMLFCIIRSHSHLERHSWVG